MKGLSRFGLALLILGAAAPLALAGANAGGWLLVHTNSTIFTTDTADYCGLSGIACGEDVGDCPPYNPSSSCNPCATVETVTGLGASDPVVFWVMAAFPDNSCPRLTGVNFGLDYDSATGDNLGLVMVASKMCGDFEITTPNSNSEAWPAPGSGTGMTWNGVKRSRLVEVYWFAAYSYTGSPQTVTAQAHPSQGAKFSDDSVPSVLDNITGFGSLGLAGATGSDPCVTPTEVTTWGRIKATYGTK